MVEIFDNPDYYVPKSCYVLYGRERTSVVILFKRFRPGSNLSSKLRKDDGCSTSWLTINQTSQGKYPLSLNLLPFSKGDEVALHCF